MNVSIVLPASKLNAVKQSLSSQKSASLNFDYSTDPFSVFLSIKNQGFYMDKLVIIATILSDMDDNTRQQFMMSLLDICNTFITQNLGEILIIDSSHLMEMEYNSSFSMFPGFVYQTQKIHPSQLYSLIAGNFQAEENPNVDNDIKKPGLFSRMFKKKNAAPAAIQPNPGISQQMPEPSVNQMPGQVPSQIPEQPVTQPFVPTSQTPLFSDADFQQEAAPQEEADAPANSLDFSSLIFDNPEPQPQEDVIKPQSYNDMPLFEDPSVPTVNIAKEPEPPQPQSIPQIVSQPQPVPQMVSQPQPVSAPFQQPQPQSAPMQFSQSQLAPPPILQSPSLPTPIQLSQPQPVPVQNLYYADFFRKRSKTILVTGDRRTGVSTVVSNLAEQASQDGLAVLIIDLDYERRGQSINFPIDCDPNDIRTTLSLYNAIKNASNIQEYALPLNVNLSMLGTSLVAEDSTIMYKHVNDDALRPLLSMAIGYYDIVLIDCPFSMLKEYSCLVTMSNIIMHCLQTDLRSIFNTVNILAPDSFSSDTEYSVYMSKTLLLLNNYVPHVLNGKEMNESNLLSFMCDLTGDNLYTALSIIGRVPSLSQYDNCMMDGNLIVMNSALKGIFINLWNNIAQKG